MTKETKVKPEDFSPAEHAAVDAMAAPIIKQHRESLSFIGSRNRDAYKRMNRPTKIDSMESGASKIYALLDRFSVGPKVD